MHCIWLELSIWIIPSEKKWICLILTDHLSVAMRSHSTSIYWLSILLTNFKRLFFSFHLKTHFLCMMPSEEYTNMWRITNKTFFGVQIICTDVRRQFAPLFCQGKKFEWFDPVKHIEMYLRSMIKCCNWRKKVFASHCRTF